VCVCNMLMCVCVCLCVSHRLPVGQQDLSPQDMEVVSRVRAVHNDPVTVVELLHIEVLREALGGGVSDIRGGGVSDIKGHPSALYSRSFQLISAFISSPS